MTLQDEFAKRWNDIVAETISTVRRQLTLGLSDGNEISLTLRNACREWTNGNLGPSIWFKKLRSISPEAAERFRAYVEEVQLNYVPIERPSKLMGIVAAPSVAIIVFSLIRGFSEGRNSDESSSHGFLFALVIAIAFGMLARAIAQNKYKKNNSIAEEKVVDSYLKQLEKHRSELLRFVP